MGNTNLQYSNLTIPIFNTPETIKSISTATALRRTLGNYDCLPEQTIVGPHWHKKNGFGGAGKIFHEDALGECAVISGDSQQHIVGQEYRVISVGDRVVQAFRKEYNGEGNYVDNLGTWDYVWIGVSGISNGGFIPLVKRAVAQIVIGDRMVAGWDIIHDGNRPFIIECNTSPGVNAASAERIYAAIEKQLEEQ